MSSWIRPSSAEDTPGAPSSWVAVPWEKERGLLTGSVGSVSRGVRVLGCVGVPSGLRPRLFCFRFAGSFAVVG